MSPREKTLADLTAHLDFLRDDSAVPTAEKPRLEDFLHDPAKS